MIGRLACTALAALGLAVAPPLVGAAQADAPGKCSTAVTNRAQNVWLRDAVSVPSDVDWFRFTTTTSEHVIVTLGGLSGDLMLGLYDAHCHLLVSSQHGGTRFEEIYRGLAAGRYFVRVVGVSGATSPYSLRFRTLPNRVVTVSSHGTVSPYGVLSIAGELLNNTAHTKAAVNIDIAAYDQANRLVAVSFNIIDMQVIPPWHRAPFDISAQIPPTYDHYALVIDDPDNRGPVVHNLSITRTQTTSGDILISGQLHNGNTFAITDAIIAAVAYDPYGRVRYVASDFLAGRRIAAGGNAAYSLDFPTLAGTNARAYYLSALPYGSG